MAENGKASPLYVPTDKDNPGGKTAPKRWWRVETKSVSSRPELASYALHEIHKPIRKWATLFIFGFPLFKAFLPSLSDRLEWRAASEELISEFVRGPNMAEF